MIIKNIGEEEAILMTLLELSSLYINIVNRFEILVDKMHYTYIIIVVDFLRMLTSVVRKQM